MKSLRSVCDFISLKWIFPRMYIWDHKMYRKNLLLWCIKTSSLATSTHRSATVSTYSVNHSGISSSLSLRINIRKNIENRFQLFCVALSIKFIIGCKMYIMKYPFWFNPFIVCMIIIKIICLQFYCKLSVYPIII